ncbi:hypothetical protein SEVIR_4G262275v4 [Setaria viridis]
MYDIAIPEQSQEERLLEGRLITDSNVSNLQDGRGTALSIRALMSRIRVPNLLSSSDLLRSRSSRDPRTAVWSSPSTSASLAMSSELSAISIASLASVSIGVLDSSRKMARQSRVISLAVLKFWLRRDNVTGSRPKTSIWIFSMQCAAERPPPQALASTTSGPDCCG